MLRTPVSNVKENVSWESREPQPGSDTAEAASGGEGTANPVSLQEEGLGSNAGMAVSVPGGPFSF